MLKSLIAISLCVFVIGLCRTDGFAQTGFRTEQDFGEPRFEIEAADFRAGREDLHSLEIYYKIFYDALSYQKTLTGYKAEYEIAILVEGEGGDQVEGIIREGDIEVKTYAETRRSTDFIINLLQVTFDRQDIKIKATMTDKLSGSMMVAEKELKKRDYWGKYPTLSRIEFSREISSPTHESKFSKGEYRVIPSVTRLFGGDFDTILSFYQEIYPGESEVKYLKEITRVYHRTKGFVYADTVDYGQIDEMQREVHNINVANLLPGDYELEIELIGRRDRKFDKIVEEFELELTAETIFRNDYETAVKMLKYLATKEEREKLEAADTPAERRTAWDEFWAIRDQGGHDRANPTRQEYFRRIRHANRYFSIMKKEGWKTTRGMIYIMYGEPDEVEDYPFELSRKPYQVWLYYRLSPPRKFMFIDEWGTGDYELQPPYNGLDW